MPKTKKIQAISYKDIPIGFSVYAGLVGGKPTRSESCDQTARTEEGASLFARICFNLSLSTVWVSAGQIVAVLWLNYWVLFASFGTMACERRV